MVIKLLCVEGDRLVFFFEVSERCLVIPQLSVAYQLLTASLTKSWILDTPSGLVPGLHFYTLNLEKVVMSIIDGLDMIPANRSIRSLPWRPSTMDKRRCVRMWWAKWL